MNHGVATSIYYADPDGNEIELTVEAFPSVEALNGWFATGAFDTNPFGVIIDPDDLCARVEAGEPEAEILKPTPTTSPGSRISSRAPGEPTTTPTRVDSRHNWWNHSAIFQEAHAKGRHDRPTCRSTVRAVGEGRPQSSGQRGSSVAPSSGVPTRRGTACRPSASSPTSSASTGTRSDLPSTNSSCSV